MKLIAGRGLQTFKREVCISLGREGRRVQERELSSLAYTAWRQKYKRKTICTGLCGWNPLLMLLGSFWNA